MRASSILRCWRLPSLLLALVLVAPAPSIVNNASLSTFVAPRHHVRLTRAAVLVRSTRLRRVTARVVGAGAMRQMFVNILPNLFSRC